MGCCQSFPSHSIHLAPVTNPQYASPIESTEAMLLIQVLNKIPPPFRQSIANLPARPFLKVYQLHLLAIYHMRRQELLVASRHELQAINGLETLLPNHRDHILFVDMYGILSISLLGLDRVPEALNCCKTALTLLLQHNPTDYTELCGIYYHMASCYKGVHAWREAIACLTKTMETIRLCPTPDEEYFRKAEADIELIQKRINVEAILSQSDPNPGESQIDFQQRKTALMDAFNAECGSFPYDLAETQRIPEKQTELQVDEKVLKEVLLHLVQYLNEYALQQFKAGCVKATFLAAAFKIGRMKSSLLSPAVVEEALTMIVHRIDEYDSLKELPLLLSYTDDSNSFVKGVREFSVTAKEGINLNESSTTSYETRDCFW